MQLCLRLFYFSIYDLQQFLHEVKFSVELDLIDRNNKVIIWETLSEITHVEGIVKFAKLLR